MRCTPHSSFWIPLFGGFLVAFASCAKVSAAQLRVPSADPVVEIRQLQEVKQGESSWFEVKIHSKERQLPVTLRLRRFSGTGAASFEDGSDEYRMAGSGDVQIRGVVASDLAGGIALTAWIDGGSEPAATAFFEVIAARPQPRIFWSARDITDT